MIKNYLVVAMRSLMRQKVYTAVNVFGLAVGIAFCILTFLFVRHEWTYDQFHEKADRIYRVIGSFNFQNQEHWSAIQPAPFGPALMAEFPEIERMTRFCNDRNNTVIVGDQFFAESVTFVDPNVFSVFTFPLVQGDPNSALADPKSVVLTEHAAVRFFGDADPLGQTINVRARGVNGEDFVVTGVVKDLPHNSSISFTVLLPFSRIEPRIDNWNANEVRLFLLLKPDVVAAKLAAKFKPFVRERWAKMFERFGREDVMAKHLQPVTEIHSSRLSFALESQNNPHYPFILAGMATATLLIACINFMTMSLGRASARFKEVGVRKILGAMRTQLMYQFWGEAMVLSFMALALGLVLVEFTLPIFESLIQTEFVWNDLIRESTLLFLVGLTVITGLVAGSYPALSLSDFRPVEILKGRSKIGGLNFFSRGLMTVQFAVSVFLIAFSLVMTFQLNFMSDKSLGFDQEQVVGIDLTGISNRKWRDVGPLLKQEITQYSGVVGAALTSHSLANHKRGGGITKMNGKFQIGDQSVRAERIFVDEGFVPTMGIALLDGRNFSPEYGRDEEQAILINRAFVRALSLDEPVGMVFKAGKRTYTVIGVVDDFHFRSLHQEIEPAALLWGTWRHQLLVRIQPYQVSETLAFLKSKWQDVAPNVSFSYGFMQDDLQHLYQEEQRWRRIVGYAAGLAALIACLGVFGLTALAAVRRTKEIGIRKVLGASSSNIVGLLSKEFVIIVLISNFIAWPAVYWAANQWLEEFAYRIEIGASVFVLAGLLILITAFVTASFQGIKAALSNPVDALRSE